MIEKRAQQNGQSSHAWYSPCEAYRYGLRREWAPTEPMVVFIMLNPSTATELRNDPTIERCQRRAQAMGFGRMGIVNLFGFRATRPEDLHRAKDPFGPDNDAVIAQLTSEADMTIAAWGVHGARRGAGPRMAAQLNGDVYHLGLTKAGHPRHPLYVAYKTKPVLWALQDRVTDTAM